MSLNLLRAIALAAVALATPIALAQFTLTPQSPTPTGRNLGGVAFTSPSHAFIVGDNHHLLESTDAGQTWITRMATDLSTDPFYTIAFPSPTHGYIAGNNQDAYRTTNGGQTWTQMTTFPAGSARVFDFITPTTGFVGLNGALLWTPDGGLTWQLRGQYPDAVITFGMDFRDANVGLICGIRSTPHDDGGIYRSLDGGRTVTLVSDVGTNDVLWISPTSAIAVGGTFVLRSDDEGLTWFPAAGGIDTGLADADRAGSSDVICAVSTKGDIWQSTDLGFSWAQRVVGIGTLPGSWSVTMADDMTGMVVGTNGLTYRTSDAGATWTLLNNGCGDEIQDIQFLNENFGIAVTRNGYVFRTRDGGLHWDVQIARVTGQVFGRSEGLACVAIIDENNAVIAGQGGLCFRTFDGGETWQNIGYPNALPPYLDIHAIKFTDSLTGYLTGNFPGDTNTYATTDGGASWNPLPGPLGFGIAVERKGDRIWVSTAADVVDRSFNAGLTWTRTAVPGASVSITDLQFADENIGYAVSRYGNISKTTNGGVSWTTTQRGQEESYFSVGVVNASEVWIMGATNSPPFSTFYLRTTNGGTTWTRTQLPLAYAESVTQLFASRAGRVWMAGSFGKILASPPIPFRIALPNDTPVNVPVASDARVLVRVTPGAEQIAPGTPTMWFRRTPAAAYEALPLNLIAGEDYEATLPRLRCSDRPQFYFTAQGTGGTVLSLPANAPTSVYTTRVGSFNPIAPLLSESFDAGLPATWTASGLWHVTSACAPAGACGSGARAYFGIDAGCTFNNGLRVVGSLFSPTITLPTLQPGQSITLSYCHALRTQNGEQALSDFDRAEVWFRISPTQFFPLDWTVDRNLSRTVTYDMTPHAGRTGRIEWHFDSVSNAQNAFRGWHVDNVLLTAPALVCADPCVADVDNGTFSGTPDGGVTIDDLLYFLTIYADGTPRADVDDGSSTGTPDGGVTIDDLLYFLLRFDAGC